MSGVDSSPRKASDEMEEGRLKGPVVLANVAIFFANCIFGVGNVVGTITLEVKRGISPHKTLWS